MAALLGCFGSSAFASDPIPAPSNYGALVVDLANGDDSNNYSYSAASSLDVSFNLDGSTTEITDALSPKTAATAIVYNGNGSLVADVQAFTTSTYWFEVTGPAATSVPIYVDASLRLTGGYGYFSEAKFDLAGVQVALICSVAGCAGAPAVFADNVTGTTVVATDTPVSIDMLAYAESSLTGVSSSAMVDPFIGIDATFLAGHPGYSILLYPGVGNAPVGGVPEPAPWSMMLVGFGGLGAVMRSSRRGAMEVAR